MSNEYTRGYAHGSTDRPIDEPTEPIFALVVSEAPDASCIVHNHHFYPHVRLFDVHSLYDTHALSFDLHTHTVGGPTVPDEARS